MIIKRSLSYTLWGSISDKGNANDFLDVTGEKFKESDKAEIANLSSFMNKKSDNGGGIRNFRLRKLRLLLD